MHADCGFETKQHYNATFEPSGVCYTSVYTSSRAHMYGDRRDALPVLMGNNLRLTQSGIGVD